MSGRSTFLVCYDVTDGKRLRRVLRTVRGFGDALQYSVFACELSPGERVLLEEALLEEIDQREDRVLIVDAGPAEGRGARALTVLGKQHRPSPRQATIF